LWYNTRSEAEEGHDAHTLLLHDGEVGMSVITLSRQVGSGGDSVAVAVAERLHLRLIGRDIINQAARQAGVPQVALAEIDELGLLGLKPSRGDCDRYGCMVTEVIRAWAAQGDILFLGRGAQVALAGWPGVLRVRVIAPLALRVANIQAESNVPQEIAARLVRTRDRARASYLQRYFGRDNGDPELYDLTLNMERLTTSGAAEIIYQTVIRDIITFKPDEVPA
jgi:cytidylate kinase